ncbi:response regulator [Hirschia litorea]|uniref:Response regulator n=1 Tax=Hirschia litorea TaxID=1199156 RepID=A0ABW2IHZ3_9PROT
MKILIVDDNYHNTLIVSGMLAGAGRDIDYACCGLEALNLVETKKFDLVILDYQMPDLSGLEVLQQLNTRLGKERPKVIIMTASEDPKIEKQFRKLGCNAFLQKPLDTKELLLAL